jgi:hypothetical protein
MSTAAYTKRSCGKLFGFAAVAAAAVGSKESANQSLR